MPPSSVIVSRSPTVSHVNFDVQTLRWYIAVAEELHFARAAKSLNIARTTLSAAVKDMEAQLGYPLFVPGASPTQLTDRGVDFLATAKEAVADDEERARADAEARATQVSTLTVGYTEGVTPTKWTRIWGERFPDVALELVPTTRETQIPLLRDGSVEVAFVRLPIDRDGLTVVGLYEEVPVVVVPKEHPVAAFDRIAVTDLADEHLLQPPESVPEWAAIATEIAEGSGAPLPPAGSDEELVEYVAAGLGIVIVPQSIARLHARKDLVYRPVDGVAGSPIAIAWPSENSNDNVEEFFGIVRGRSVRSSRGSGGASASASTTKKSAAEKSAVKKSPSKPAVKNSPAKKSSAKSQSRTPTRGKRPNR